MELITNAIIMFYGILIYPQQKKTRRIIRRWSESALRVPQWIPSNYSIGDRCYVAHNFHDKEIACVL